MPFNLNNSERKEERSEGRKEKRERKSKEGWKEEREKGKREKGRKERDGGAGHEPLSLVPTSHVSMP